MISTTLLNYFVKHLFTNMIKYQLVELIPSPRIDSSHGPVIIYRLAMSALTPRMTTGITVYKTWKRRSVTSR